MLDLNIIENFYKDMGSKINSAKSILDRPMTLTEKILYSHLNQKFIRPFVPGKSYVDFNPDRVAMQDATAQMALLQFMMAGKSNVAVPSTVHCDHLIQAKTSAAVDLAQALDVNGEVYDFLESVSSKYGIGFWKPGAGIIHQVILENYAFPGGMMIGTDSHTVNAGGLGMIAIGVGGADAVDVMAGMPWELKFPKQIGVHLKGDLNGWASAKDIILKIAGMLTVKGGTGSVIEYFGDGAELISCTGKGTICNMGAEVGATTSLFGYDSEMRKYLQSTGRNKVSDLADEFENHLRADKEVLENPSDFFDQVIELDLATLEPHINGPFSPDKSRSISKMKNDLQSESWPTEIQVGLIGSCTNSSYEDISRAASIAKQARKLGLKTKSKLTITPGSEQVRYTIERDGFIDDFKSIGAEVFSNACGPCIGQWDRPEIEKNKKNSIIHSFNRNFAKRADGNPNTHAFVASPEVVTAIAIAGDLRFNPSEDFLINSKGKKVRFSSPEGLKLPENGFEVKDLGYKEPPENSSKIEVKVNPKSDRLQLLEPFAAWDGENILNMRLLIKAKGKCTTDHISMAGPWLKYRGHLDNISENMLTGAINFFNDKPNSVMNYITKSYEAVPKTQRDYQSKSVPTIVVGDENYGEGSSREHAAMEPRFLGVRVILVKSFARIHETNLKKQGMLALTFKNPEDYDLIMEDDLFSFTNLDKFNEDENLIINILHKDGTNNLISCVHTYNKSQIEWFKAGSALNLINSTNYKDLD
jgi:aconitate hydratase